MFYKRYEIDSHLTCPKCLRRFDIPIGLPCGFCICETCLQQLTYSQTICILTGAKTNWEIDCPFCKEKHQVPEDNFPIMQSVADLLSLNPSRETHDIVFNEFKTILNEFGVKMEDLKKDLTQSFEKINEHAKDVKQEIFNRVQTLMEIIEKYEKNLVEKLMHFESDKNKSVNDSVASIVKEVSAKLNEWNFLLNNEANNEKQKIKMATFEAIRLIEKLDSNIIELNGMINDASNIEFIESSNKLEQSIVGSIKRA